MKNIREKKKEPRPSHRDFIWFRSRSSYDRCIGGRPDRHWKKYVSLINEGWDFGIVLWGALGSIEEVDLTLAANRMIIRDVSEHGKVRELMESIDWDEIPNNWMGAPNTDPFNIVQEYEKKRREWIEKGILSENSDDLISLGSADWGSNPHTSTNKLQWGCSGIDGQPKASGESVDERRLHKQGSNL